jgi:scyllo-inositol 2-dehydrogenase (NADP+)
LSDKVKVGVVGLGKMGISHLAAFRAHPDVDLVGVCDTSRFARDVLAKYTGLVTFSSLDDLIGRTDLDAVVVATPSHLHATMVRQALDRNLHVFCEKPFTLDPRVGTELSEEAERRGLVTKVGYHNRHVAAFAEVKQLLEVGAIGRVTHVLAEAYGPVVLKEAGSSWRTRKTDGGGCLYDYAAHPVDLLTWYLGEVESASGSVLNSVFSKETDDEVFSTLHFPDGVAAQLSVSWSDESQRKMSTKLTLWGTQGRITADRQEIQVFLRRGAVLPEGYTHGWNVRYTTDLTPPVWYYLRGEEYSAQVDSFVQAVIQGDTRPLGSFRDANRTDRALALIVRDADRAARTTATSQDDAVALVTPRTRVHDVLERLRAWLRRRTRRTGSGRN